RGEQVFFFIHYNFFFVYYNFVEISTKFIHTNTKHIVHSVTLLSLFSNLFIRGQVNMKIAKRFFLLSLLTLMVVMQSLIAAASPDNSSHIERKAVVFVLDASNSMNKND